MSSQSAHKFKNLSITVVILSPHTVQINQNGGVHDLYSTNVEPKDPIFVLFTSGSTGTPKGMVHEHGAICTHAIAHGEVMKYHGARVLQPAAHTFDVAVMDIFTTLIFGGCVCIPSEEERKSNIIGAINNMKVDYAILTPSFARILQPSDVQTLKTLVVGGEALPQDGLKGWLENGSLIQIYGAAEVGICLSINMRYNHTRAETIGFPLPNCSCWLVNPEDPHRLVPIGAIGELVVAGPSIAREYLGDKLKTEASFLENLDWAKPLNLECTRFFRTGDLLRYNTDCFNGSFDFVGRKDMQIKLRGQRIQPAEIEHHMATIPGVAISMATRPNGGPFAGQLVIVVEMRSAVSSRVRTDPIRLVANQSLGLDNVKRHLSKVLPGYMIPTVCLVVNNMPFVPSLKINRKLVVAWLEDMASTPLDTVDAALADLMPSRLDPSEITANLLSIKVAEIVASKDMQRRLILESHDFVLHATGIDSIQIISISMFLRKACKIWRSDNFEAPPRVDIFQESEFLSEKLFNSIELATINNIQSRKRVRPLIQNIFITGATGYLGSAILQKLMEKPHVHVFALVCCPQEALGFKSVMNSSINFGWWKESFTHRVHIWQGNLNQKDFGLDDAQLQCLQGHFEDPISDYETLKAVNINSTLNLLEIAALSPQISQFVYVSGGQKPDEDFTIEKASKTQKADLEKSNGYTQTKMISELVVQKCAASKTFGGTICSIIKPGYIIGSPKLGIANQSDFIWRLVAGCIEIGAYNRDEMEHWLFIADVESVADYVVNPIFGGENHSSPARRVLNGLWFSELWELLRSEFGYKLEALGFEIWVESMKRSILAKGEQHLLFPLMHVLEAEGGQIGSAREPIGLTEDSKQRVKESIKSNVRHFIDVGFIKDVKV